MPLTLREMTTPTDRPRASELQMPVPFDEIPLHRLLGMKIVERSAERAVVTMPVSADSVGNRGRVHGGAYATLVDVVCGVAAAQAGKVIEKRQSMVTTDLHVRYLANAKGTEVTATATAKHTGSRMIVVSCDIKDGEGRVVVTADAAMMVMPLPAAAAGLDGKPPPTAPAS